MADPSGPKLISEEALRAVTLGEPSFGPIVLREHDPRWAAQYAREAARVRTLLGDRVALLEHVGSTSVADLPAKPIIDMLLAVRDAADEPSYVPPLEAGGYVLRIREPDWYAHRLFKGPDTDINLHVFSEGCVEIGRMLRFRDRLRRHAGDRALYAATKRELSRRTWRFVQHYADAKSEVVEAIVARALKDVDKDVPGSAP